MKYCFTTLAVGEPYEELTAKLYTSLREKTQNCEFFITTNNPDFPDLGERIHINRESLQSLHDSRGGFSFHLNYKCLSLKQVLTNEKEMLRINPEFKIFDYVSVFKYILKLIRLSVKYISFHFFHIRNAT